MLIRWLFYKKNTILLARLCDLKICILYRLLTNLRSRNEGMITGYLLTGTFIFQWGGVKLSQEHCMLVFTSAWLWYNSSCNIRSHVFQTRSFIKESRMVLAIWCCRRVGRGPSEKYYHDRASCFQSCFLVSLFACGSVFCPVIRFTPVHNAVF